MKAILPLLAIALFASCSTGIEQPKGTSQGYKSAKLIERNPDAEVTDDATAIAKEKKIHGMLQKAIQNEFTSHGMSYGKKDSQLKVAYLVMIQNNAITFHYNDYFGQNRNADAIAEYAHQKGLAHNKNADFFERVIIVVDVLDAQSNKLVYRNHYVHEMVDVPTDKVRNQRVKAAIKEALTPFFK